MSYAPISANVLSTLLAYRIVRFDTAGSYTVAYPSAASVRCHGVTLDTVLDTTSSIPVAISGVAKVYFNDTASSGSLIASDSSGRGVLHVAVSAGSYVIGVLIGPAVTITGTVADVLIQPGFEQLA